MSYEKEKEKSYHVKLEFKRNERKALLKEKMLTFQN